MTTSLPAGLLTGKDRRASPRRKARPRVKIELRRGTMGLGPNLAETLFDVSQIGVRVVTRGPVGEREEVELTLEGPRQHRPVRVEAVVVWSQPTESERYFLGLRFRKPLAYAALLDLA